MDRRGDEGRRSGTGRGRAPGETRACDARTRVVEDRVSRASRDRAGEARPRPRVGDARLLRDGRARGTRKFGRDGTHRAHRATRWSPRRREGHLRTHPYTLRGGARRKSASSAAPAACGKALLGRAHRSGIASAEKNAPVRGERLVEIWPLACRDCEKTRSRKAQRAPSFRRQ